MAGEAVDRSPCWSLLKEGSDLLKVYRHIGIVKVDRVSNGAAHNLAQLGKSGSSGSLLGSAPTCVLAMISTDCINAVA